MEYVCRQFSSVLILLFAGMVWGSIFDFYRVLRGRFHVNLLLTWVGDLLFWIVALGILTPFIFWSTLLELRLYVWLAMAGGAVFYFLFFSKLWIGLLVRGWYWAGWPARQTAKFFWGWRRFWRKLFWPAKAWRLHHHEKEKNEGSR